MGDHNVYIEERPPGSTATLPDVPCFVQVRDEDLHYEELLATNPSSLAPWKLYLEARKDANPRRRYLIYERAVKALPGSYKVRQSLPRLIIFCEGKVS